MSPGCRQRDATRSAGRRPNTCARRARWSASMPQPLLDAAREPFAAQAVDLRPVLEPGRWATSGPGNCNCSGHGSNRPLYQADAAIAAGRAVAAGRRLGCRWSIWPMPALKRSSPQQYVQFRADRSSPGARRAQVDLFEYCLRMVLFSYLDVHFGLKKPPAGRYRTITRSPSRLAVALRCWPMSARSEPEEVRAGVSGRARTCPGKLPRCPASSAR